MMNLTTGLLYSKQHNLKKFLFTCLAISLLFHLLAAKFSSGFYHADEHFQIMEFAALKLGKTTTLDLPWEHQSCLRPALQPAIAYGTSRFFESLGIYSPFVPAIFLRLCSAILSLICIYLLILSFISEVRHIFLKKALIVLACFIWFIPYLHVRFSSENWSGIFFLIGMASLYLHYKGQLVFKKPNLIYFIVGLLLGFSFVFRYQMGVAIAGFGLWFIFIKRENLRHTGTMAIGVLLPILLGILVDFWFYEKWVLTSWNYFNVNLLEDKVSSFGVHPWWFYIKQIYRRGTPPFSILIVLSTLIVWWHYPKHLISWISLPFILLHTLIGHKELRFLFPLVNLAPFFLIFALQAIIQYRTGMAQKLKQVLFHPYFAKAFFIVNGALLLVACIKPANQRIVLYQHIYKQYQADKPIEIIYLEHNPYSRGQLLPIHFYKTRNLKLTQICQPEELKAALAKSNSTHKKLIILLTSAKKTALQDDYWQDLNLQLVYQTFPDWILRLNFNNWVERSDGTIWTILERVEN